MADTQLQYDDSVRYFLFSESQSPLEIDAPIGWKDDNIELDRHELYYGIFTSFTGALNFTGAAKDYLLFEYDTLGVNAKTALVKQELVENASGEIKWTTIYSGLADWLTMIKTEKDLSVKFNSNDIVEILKAHGKDDVEIDIFEANRRTDIDGNPIPAMIPSYTKINGRTLSYNSEQKLKPVYYIEETSYPQENEEGYYQGKSSISPLTEIISQGHPRFASVDTFEWDANNITASNLFIVNDTVPGDPIYINLNFDVKFYVNRDFINELQHFEIGIWEFDDQAVKWNFVKSLFKATEVDVTDAEFEYAGEILNEKLEWNQGVGLYVYTPRAFFTPEYYNFSKISIIGDTRSFYEPSNSIRFAFMHDVGERLIEILTGSPDNFYSQYFGRNELPQYTQDGEMGLVGVLSGLWARAFIPGSEKYKSLRISWEKWIRSAQATFNVGLGVENITSSERVRIEDKRFFFQDRVGIRLPFQATNIKRKTIADMFFTGIKTGYKRGGDYDSEMGLDEPNTQTSRITPIRKGEKKYEVISDIRADEYGLELTRRKPQLSFPNDDTKRDEANWYLDLKRNPQYGYEQIHYTDRVEPGTIPENISDPDSFRSLIFTPLQVALRHGWSFTVGMDKYGLNTMKYGDSVANSALGMQLIGQPKYYENQDLKVNDFDRALFQPEEITFNHAIDNKLIQELLGYSTREWDGVEQLIRNYYLQIEFLNEFQEWERGYLLNAKPEGRGTFRLIKANEEII
jgi:hypothetical protein